MADANALVVQIRADTSEMKKALINSEKQLRDFGETVQKVQKYVSGFNVSFRDFTVMGVGLVQIKTYLQSLIGQFTTFGDLLDKTSQRVGIMAGDLSRLKFAAEQCGGNFEALNIGLRDLFKNLEAAKAGDATGLKNLAQLDLTPAILSGMSMKETFLEVADALSNLDSDTQKVKVAMSLFGEQGYQLLPMLKQGRVGIEALMAEAERLGIVFDDADVKNAAAMSDEINRVKTTFSDLTRSGVASIAPELIQGMEAVRGFAQGISSAMVPIQNWIAFLAKSVTVFYTFRLGMFLGNQTMKGTIQLWNTMKIALIGAHGPLRQWRFLMSQAQIEAWRFHKSVSMMNVTLGVIKWQVQALGKVILHSMKTNPVGWIMGLVSAGVLLYQAFAPATKELKSFSEAMQESQDKSAKTQEELQGYQAKMDRLKALAVQERLTNKEKEESARLVAQLNRQYPTLGLEIDKVTGKLKNAGDAQARLNQLQRNKMLVEKRQELAAAKRSQKETDDAINEFHQAINNEAKTTYETTLRYTGSKELAFKHAEQEKQKKYDELWMTGGWGRDHDYYKTAFKNKPLQDAKVPLLEEEIRLLEGGEDIFKNSFENSAIEGKEQRGNAAKFLEEKRLERLTENEKELDNIDQKYKQLGKDIQEALNALETQKTDGLFPTKELDEEYQRLKNLQSSLDSLRNEEIVLVESRYNDKETAQRIKAEQDAAQKQIELQSKIAQIEKDFAAQNMEVTEKELVALQEKNAEYLKQIELLHGVESAEARVARAANEKRIQDFAAKMSLEELEKSQMLLEKERKENEYYRLLADEKVSWAQVETAKQDMDKAVENYQKYSITQAKKKMDITAEAEKKAEEEYRQINGDTSFSMEEKSRSFDHWQNARNLSEEARQNWIQQSDRTFQKRFQDSKEAMESRGSAKGTFSAWEAGNGGMGDILTRQLREQKTFSEIMRDAVRELKRMNTGVR